MTPVGGREASHREKRLMAMLPKSARRCAASVMMARLWAAYPPAGEVRSQKAGLFFFSLCKQLKYHSYFFFVPTNHLSSHEEEAHGAGHAQLPPGPMPGVTGRPWRGVGLLAEPLPPPQLVLIRGTLAPFWSRIATGLQRWTDPRRQNNQKTKTHMKERQTYHPRGLGWEWISCCFSENSMSSVNPPQGLTLV